jgi:hypothetical protein
MSNSTLPTFSLKSAFGLATEGTEEELDLFEPLDLLEEDEPAADEPLVPELLKPAPELEDASCPELEESGSGSVLGGKGSSPCPEEELTPPCTGEEEEDPLAIEEDESPPPTGLVGSVCGSGLLQVIRKNTNATIAGSARRTLRFTIRFINTSR